MEGLPGWVINPMPGPPPRQHKHERQYTPSTHPFIPTRRIPVWNYDYGGQMIFGDLVGLKFPDICLTDEEKPRKNLTQENCPDRESNPGPLRDKRACYNLLHRFRPTSGHLQMGKTPGSLENELCCTSLYLWALLILQPFRHFTYATAHFPTIPSLYLRHSSFPNPSFASPTSQFILQPFFRFSYVTSSSLTSPGESLILKFL